LRTRQPRRNNISTNTGIINDLIDNVDGDNVVRRYHSAEECDFFGFGLYTFDSFELFKHYREPILKAWEDLLDLINSSVNGNSSYLDIDYNDIRRYTDFTLEQLFIDFFDGLGVSSSTHDFKSDIYDEFYNHFCDSFSYHMFGKLVSGKTISRRDLFSDGQEAELSLDVENEIIDFIADSEHRDDSLYQIFISFATEFVELITNTLPEYILERNEWVAAARDDEDRFLHFAVRQICNGIIQMELVGVIYYIHKK